MADPRFWRVVDDAVLVQVRLTPKSSVDRIDGPGIDGDGNGQLKARVRAVPEDGKANKALTAVLAKSLGVPKSAVTVVAGPTSRSKTLRIAGDSAALTSALAKL
ncbi:DUF167 family protein [Aurantimonas marina]|uniref:DUF167 family protein n=1 Tax=Aurantimonas marina TaxID=2780508 RepID=UPI0019CFDF4D